MSTQVRFFGPGPMVTVQDLGRPGLMASGLSRGGAMDRLALLEAAALLQSADVLPAFEIAGYGGSFEVSHDTRVALTGAPMAATLEGAPLIWNATHLIPAGARLTIGAALAGTYGYLACAGGIETPLVLGSQAMHLGAGIGQTLKPGDQIAIGLDPLPDAPQQRLDTKPRYSGGRVHMIAGPQTNLFPPATLADFLGARFTKSNRANRQGIALDHPSLQFASDKAAGLASDFIQPGDIQMTGAGVPYVLMSESQTTGGYPRIGTVIPKDLPIIAQAPTGAELQFELIDLESATAQHKSDDAVLAGLRAKVSPLLRDPTEMSDLLSYQLISGMTAGEDIEDL